MSTFREGDIVRVRKSITGQNPYESGAVQSVSAGDTGVVLVGGPGSDAYDVEFASWKNEQDWATVILIIPAEDLEPAA